MDRLWTEVCGQQKQSNDPGNNQHILNTPIIGRRSSANGTPCHIQHSPNTPTTGLRERGNDTSKSTSRSGRQKAATRRTMRREERVTVQGPVKEQQPDGMSHRGGRGSAEARRFGGVALRIIRHGPPVGMVVGPLHMAAVLMATSETMPLRGQVLSDM